MSTVAGTIADPQVRHRGTIGGSLAHGDSASDLPAAMLISEAEVTLQGPRPAHGGRRDFSRTICDGLGADEVLTEIRVPALDGYGHAYQKFNRRSEDWAMVGVCAVVRSPAGRRGRPRGLTNMASVPLRATAVEEALRGRRPARRHCRRPPSTPPRAPTRRRTSTPRADYKRHLARVLTRRALTDAARIADNIAEVTLAELERSAPRATRWRGRATWPIARWPWRCTWPWRWSSRCCSRARPAWARPRSPGRWRPPPARELIRLQCHEGIDLHHAVYDWDYSRQLLALRAAEGGVDEGELFARRFLLRRPLLEALEADPAEPVVLLIDEIDRADDEFEAFLLEFLSDFAVTIPELGTITAAGAPWCCSPPTAPGSCMTRSSGAASTTGSTTRRPSASARSSIRACPGSRRRSPRGWWPRCHGCATRATCTSSRAWARRSYGRRRCWRSATRPSSRRRSAPR